MAFNEKLMEEIKKGNISALEQIYTGTKNAVFSVVYSIVRDYGKAEELMQDTYIKVWDNIGSYNTRYKALGWICTIARNLAINSYNKNKREVFTDFEEEQKINLGPSKEIVLKDESGVFKAMEKTLDANEYKIVLMHTLGGMKLKEIAAVIGSPQGTVRWQYNNALNKLKKTLAKEDEKQ
jgi:RNA polymerase sigma-70 factor (ECF subfamily)